MNDNQIKIAANSIVGLCDATGSQIDDVMEILSGNIISEEDCGRIRDYLLS